MRAKTHFFPVTVSTCHRVAVSASHPPNPQLPITITPPAPAVLAAAENACARPARSFPVTHLRPYQCAGKPSALAQAEAIRLGITGETEES